MKNGFTLIEILIVVALLAITAVVVIPNLRKFNEDQDLISASNSLKQALRIAQSSASSGTKCSTLPAQSWKVSIQTQQLNVVALCLDPSTQASPSPEARTPMAFPQGISVSSDNCGVLGNVGADIIFTSGKISFTCNNGLFVSSPFIVTLSSSKSTQTMDITIDSGGLIY